MSGHEQKQASRKRLVAGGIESFFLEADDNSATFEQHTLERDANLRAVAVRREKDSKLRAVRNFSNCASS